MKTKIRLLPYLCICLCFLFIPKAKSGYVSSHTGFVREQFNPVLAIKIKSVSDLLTYTDSISSFPERQSLPYAEALVQTVRERFYHGYSSYSFSDNWCAALAGNLIWNHLHAIVIPDDILKHPNAACSQQSIVLMNAFKQVGIPYRAIKFAHHYALEAQIKGKWFYFDPNLEPRFTNGRKSLDNLIASGEFYPAYQYRQSKTEIKTWMGNLYPVHGNVNEEPARNARLFHVITKFISSYLFIGLAITSLALAGFKKYPFSNYTIEKAEKENDMLLNA